MIYVLNSATSETDTQPAISWSSAHRNRRGTSSQQWFRLRTTGGRTVRRKPYRVKSDKCRPAGPIGTEAVNRSGKRREKRARGPMPNTASGPVPVVRSVSFLPFTRLAMTWPLPSEMEGRDRGRSREMSDALSGWLYGGAPAPLLGTGGWRAIRADRGSPSEWPRSLREPLMARGKGGPPAAPVLHASPTVERGEL